MNMSIIERAAVKLAEDQVEESGVDLEERMEDGTAPNSGASLLEENDARHRVDIDLAKLRAHGLLTPDTPYVTLVEQYRMIKRPLLMKASVNGHGSPTRAGGTGGAKNVIMVTSALPGEGKTFTAINLAVSIATERDRTVLLVDTDVTKGDVSRQFGIESERGLSSLLAESETALTDVLIKTNIAKLSLLPAGGRYRNYTELIASQTMRNLIMDLASRSKELVIILDSAPLLASSGASVLAHLAGQIVVVVQAGRTPQSMLREALRLLTPGTDVSLVLNRDSRGSLSRYGYYYGYGYPNYP
jgi:protein-tyrosine kinase